MIDKELTRITFYRVINVFITGSIITFTGVYITKYCNIMVDLDKLYSVGLIGSIITLSMIQIIKKDWFLDWCQRHMYLLVYLENIIEALTLTILWISPLLYLIAKVIYHSVMERLVNSAWSDMNNFIYEKRQRSKYNFAEVQAKHSGYILGSIIGYVIDDLSITPIIVVAIIGVVIDLPLSLIRLKMMLNRIKRLGLKEM